MNNMTIFALTSAVFLSSPALAHDHKHHHKHHHKHEHKWHGQNDHDQRDVRETIIIVPGPVEVVRAPDRRRPRVHHARVTSVEPIVRKIRQAEPQRVCWEEERSVRSERAYAPVVLGSIVGGVVGNQFGEGKGKDAATVAGALLGAAVVHDGQRDRGYRTVSERRCETQNTYSLREEVVGYNVTYRFRGDTYTRRMDRHPGDHVRVDLEEEDDELYYD